MQGGVGGGGHWGPNCNEPALGGPSLQKVENPCSKRSYYTRTEKAAYANVHLEVINTIKAIIQLYACSPSLSINIAPPTG